MVNPYLSGEHKTSVGNQKTIFGAKHSTNTASTSIDEVRRRDHI